MKVIPGLLLAFALAVLGNLLADWLALSLGLGAGAISGIMVAILLGLALGNLFTLPSTLKPGVDFSVKTVLRIGIVLLGLKLSIVEVGSIGLKSLAHHPRDDSRGDTDRDIPRPAPRPS